MAGNLPDNLDVKVIVEGKLQKLDQNSLLGVRIDYEVNGRYSKAILFHGPYNGVDLYSKDRNAVYPWGTQKQADEVIAVEDLSAFQIPLNENAPSEWKGKAHIGFIMHNAGSGTRAKINMR